VPQSADDSVEVELQSAQLKRTELQLIRQIESIQEERSVLFIVYYLRNTTDVGSYLKM